MKAVLLGAKSNPNFTEPEGSQASIDEKKT